MIFLDAAFERAKGPDDDSNISRYRTYADSGKNGHAS